MLGKLITTFIRATDTIGVPLFNEDMLMHEWDQQKRHVPCIQDPEGVQLYKVVGTIQKGQSELPKYRCAITIVPVLHLLYRENEDKVKLPNFVYSLKD